MKRVKEREQVEVELTVQQVQQKIITQIAPRYMASIGRCENMAAIERATEIMFDQVGDVVLPDYKIYIKPNPELFAKRKSTKLSQS